MSISMFAVGSSMILASMVGTYKNLPSTQLKQVTNQFFREIGLEDVRVCSIFSRPYGYDMAVRLPLRSTFQKFEATKDGLEQACGCAIEYLWNGGKYVTVKCGMSPLSDVIPFDKDKKYPPLVVPLMTPYGERLLNFNDESSAHLLVGGATRMGKSSFLQMATACLLKGTKGKIEIVMVSNKLSDFYPFADLPQVTLAETNDECLISLNHVYNEALERRAYLKDTKSHKGKFKPLFIIIDEFARFADSKSIQEMVTWIAETTGYLNIHLIIASQRPDATSVLKPRIKANLLTRICFKTADEANSKIVLDNEDAAKLPKIKGRSVLLDSLYYQVHVPYLNADDIQGYLKEFYREDESHVSNQEGLKTDTNIEPMESLESEADRETDIPQPKKRKSNRKPSAKKAGA